MKTWRLILAMWMVSFGLFGQGIEKTESNATLPETVKSVKLFPNPAIEYLDVKFEVPQAKQVKLGLSNIIGSKFEIESEVIDDYLVRIRVKEMPAGVYLLSIHNEENGLKGAYKFLKK